MNLYELLGWLDKDCFDTLDEICDFAREFLLFIACGGMQGEFVSRKETKYCFYQFKQEANYNVSRPINKELFLTYNEFDEAKKMFLESLKKINDIKEDQVKRKNINKFIYTCQQCVGIALDGLNNQNKARKRNGDIFEKFIRCVISETGVSVSKNKETISYLENEKGLCFEQDVIIKNFSGEVKGVGQIKTSSKDRLSKAFVDKYMYNKLKDVDIPHFAIFLNDVQRKNSKTKDGSDVYDINSTFLPGHFIAYSVILNPLDGVYYFDINPSMKKNSEILKYIKNFDSFLVEDLWMFLEK